MAHSDDAEVMGPVYPRLSVVALLCESFFCGALTVLFGISVYVVLFRRPRSRTTYALLAVNIVLYAVAVTHWIVNSTITLGVVSVGRGHRLIAWLSPIINHIISDSVLLWRAWLICDRNAMICIPSFICLVGVLATLVITMFIEPRSSRGLVAVSWSLTLGSILWTTSIIAWRAWQHRQFIKSHLGEGTARTNTEKILGLLIESGAFYCCIWAVYLAIWYGLRTAIFIPRSILVQLVAIYPLTLIIIVHIRATSPNSLSQISSFGFATPPDISSGNADSDRRTLSSG